MYDDINTLEGEIPGRCREEPTVQTFNSCTSRQDVCQCLVVQTTMDGMSKISAKDINDTRNLQTKASFSFEVIHASMP